MPLDVNQLIQDIQTTATTLLGKDITAIRGFSARQLNGLANQSALVASAIESGQLSDSTRDFFLEQLVELAKNFVNTLVGLLIATIERLWNAIVSVIWNAISKATGITLPEFKPL
jgi:hypothetical protein